MGEKPNALSLSDRKDLVDEIFRETGMKVSADDPVVVAALIQSHLFRREGSEVVEAISNAMRVIPSRGEEIEARMSGLIGQVNRAGESYLGRIHEVVNAEAGKAITDLRKEVKAVLYAEISGPMDQIRRTNKAGIWRTLMVSMVGTVVAFGIALAGARHYVPKLYDALDIAVAFVSTWNGLTPAEQLHIQQLLNQGR